MVLQPQSSMVPPRVVLVVVPGGLATAEPSPVQAREQQGSPTAS